MPTDCANLSSGISIVIVAAYESHRLLVTLRSIPADVPDLEVVLVVPESDNYAKEIVQEVGLKNIRIFHDSGIGIYPAMNIGLSKARHTHVLFLNAGDLIIGSSQLKYCIAEIRGKSHTSYILPIQASWNGALDTCLPDLRSFIAGDEESYVSHQGVLFSTTFVTQEGKFDERFKIAADFKQLCNLYYTKSFARLNLSLVSIEFPNVSSKFNRRGRFESIIVSLFYLRGLLRIRATYIRLRTEFRNLP
jgi:glycosyltransferase involved in cell wall biosynthesis